MRPLSRPAGSRASALELRKPFDEAVGSLQGVIDAAADQVASVERVGMLLGWLVFLIPVILLLVIWLPARIRFFLRARAAQRFLDADADLDLFALRAMVVQPMHVIAKISDDPVAAWRRGDKEVIRALAAVELRRSGLIPPAGVRSERPRQRDLASQLDLRRHGLRGAVGYRTSRRRRGRSRPGACWRSRSHRAIDGAAVTTERAEGGDERHGGASLQLV